MRHRLPSKLRLSIAALLVLLALQLVLGFQWQAVQAVASPLSMDMAMRAQALKPTRAATPTQAPMPTHGAMLTLIATTANGAVTHGEASVARTAGDHPAAQQDDAAAVGPDDSAAARSDCHKHSLPHDCCHANACQCHCVYTPGIIAVPVLSNIATSVAVPWLAATQFVAPRVNEFLRPPIA